MKKDLYGFTVRIRDEDYTADEFRTLCKYENVSLSIHSDGLLDSLVDQWNLTCPITLRAELFFDGEKSTGFKRAVSFSNRTYDPIPDPRNSKGNL